MKINKENWCSWKRHECFPKCLVWHVRVYMFWSDELRRRWRTGAAVCASPGHNPPGWPSKNLLVSACVVRRLDPGGGGGGGGTSIMYAYIGYVPQTRRRPPFSLSLFSAMNFRSGAYNFHKLLKYQIRSITILNSGDHHFQNFSPFIGSARSAAPQVSARSGDSHFQAFSSAAS